LERSEEYLWHDTVNEACVSIDMLELLLDNGDALTATRCRMLKALRDFRVSIPTNARPIPTYGSTIGMAGRSRQAGGMRA
jgi:hypothetical protein